VIERTDFIAVPVQDRERAAQFYGEVLGLTKNPNSTERWYEYETGNVSLAFVSPEMMGGREFKPLPAASIVLRVADIDAARAKLEAAGVEIRGEKFDSGVCNGLAFRDSEGNGLMLHHRYAAYPDGTMP
jgi:predicted enzyme related to lactoylglutathione lyase